MPTYQYRCTSCDTDLEAVQKFTDDALSDCPECDGNLRKVFNAVGVVFKGSGFYATDNRAKSKSGAAQSAEKPEGKSPTSESKSEGKATPDSKPAAESKPSSPLPGSSHRDSSHRASGQRDSSQRASSTGASSAA